MWLKIDLNHGKLTLIWFIKTSIFNLISLSIKCSLDYADQYYIKADIIYKDCKKLHFKDWILNFEINQLFLLCFYINIYKNSKDSSAKYYQNNKEKIETDLLKISKSF